jgi:hypothetical protein
MAQMRAVMMSVHDQDVQNAKDLARLNEMRHIKVKRSGMPGGGIPSGSLEELPDIDISRNHRASGAPSKKTKKTAYSSSSSSGGGKSVNVQSMDSLPSLDGGASVASQATTMSTARSKSVLKSDSPDRLTRGLSTYYHRAPTVADETRYDNDYVGDADQESLAEEEIHASRIKVGIITTTPPTPVSISCSPSHHSLTSLTFPMATCM